MDQAELDAAADNLVAHMRTLPIRRGVAWCPHDSVHRKNVEHLADVMNVPIENVYEALMHAAKRHRFGTAYQGAGATGYWLRERVDLINELPPYGDIPPEYAGRVAALVQA